MTSNKRNLNVSEAADLLGIGPDKVRDFIRSGELPAVNYGNVRPYYVMERADVLEFKRSRSVRPQREAPKVQRVTRRFLDANGRRTRSEHAA